MLNSPADQKSPFVHATNKQTKLLHFTGLVQNFSGKESDNICEKMFEEIFGNLIFVQNVIENKINFYKASTKFCAPLIASKVQEAPQHNLNIKPILSKEDINLQLPSI